VGRTNLKINFGKPPEYIGPFQLAEKIMFWVPKETNELGFPKTPDKVLKFGEWLAYGSILPESETGQSFPWQSRKPTLLNKLLSRINRIRKQNEVVRIDSWDIWAGYLTLAKIILPLLEKISKSKMSAPFVDLEDVPEELRVQDASEYGDIYQYKRWEWVLGEMIFAFRSIVDDSWRESFRVDFEEMKKCDERIQNGLVLFGKYFQALWT
jgi:hypothetical protein